MPRLIRFYIRNCLIGFLWAAVFVALLLFYDVAGLWHLISTSDVGVMAGFLLFFFNGIVFAGAQCGVAILLMSEPEDSPPRGRRRRIPAPQLQSVPVTIR